MNQLLKPVSILFIVVFLLLLPIPLNVNMVNQKGEDDEYSTVLEVTSYLLDKDKKIDSFNEGTEKADVQIITSREGLKLCVDESEPLTLKFGINEISLNPGSHEFKYSEFGESKSVGFEIFDISDQVIYIYFETFPDEYSLSVTDEVATSQLPKINHYAKMLFHEDVHFKMETLKTIYHFDQHYTRIRFYSGEDVRLDGRVSLPMELYFILDITDHGKVITRDGEEKDLLNTVQQLLVSQLEWDGNRNIKFGEQLSSIVEKKF